MKTRATVGRPVIVYTSAIAWAYHVNRQQEIACRLARDYGMVVLFVEPPARGATGLLGSIQANRVTAGSRQRKPGMLGQEASPGMLFFRPAGGHRFERLCRLINRLNQRRIADQVRRCTRELHLVPNVLWLTDVRWVDALQQFPECLVVYDCIDDQRSIGRLTRTRVVARMEEELAGRADLVFASSRPLYERLRPLSRSCHLVPNAVDLEHFGRASSAPEKRPDDMGAVGSPIIGYVGGVTGRHMSFAFVRDVIAARPEWAFVFVGDGDRLATRAASLRNVHVLGSRPYETLPAYISAFDVCTIPYRTDGIVSWAYPKKVHEYLAAGKPVVATDLPELRQFEGVVKIARTPHEFIEKIEECLAENADPVVSRRLVAQRQAVARENTWEKRVEQIVGILDAELRGRGQQGVCRRTGALCSGNTASPHVGR